MEEYRNIMRCVSSVIIKDGNSQGRCSTLILTFENATRYFTSRSHSMTHTRMRRVDMY